MNRIGESSELPVNPFKVPQTCTQTLDIQNYESFSNVGLDIVHPSPHLSLLFYWTQWMHNEYYSPRCFCRLLFLLFYAIK